MQTSVEPQLKAGATAVGIPPFWVNSSSHAAGLAVSHMCSLVFPAGSCTKCLATVTLQSLCKRLWLHTSEGRTPPPPTPHVWRLQRPVSPLLVLVPPHFLALLSHQLERFATAALWLCPSWTCLKRREGSWCQSSGLSLLAPMKRNLPSVLGRIRV